MFLRVNDVYTWSKQQKSRETLTISMCVGGGGGALGRYIHPPAGIQQRR